MTKTAISEINSFWLGDSQQSPDLALARKDFWYRGGEAVDDDIRARFGDLVAQACDGGFADWAETADGALALILLLDQFTRNLYRHTAQAYAGDAIAFAVVSAAVEKNMDQSLHPISKIWLYHPFHHSEELAAQDRVIDLLKGLKQTADPAWQPYVQRSIDGFTRHRDIVARFGRFPHRNAVLGRTSTAEEEAFLTEDGNAFGQGMKTPSPDGEGGGVAAG